jgi:hypothetical protein
MVFGLSRLVFWWLHPGHNSMGQVEFSSNVGIVPGLCSFISYELALRND